MSEHNEFRENSQAVQAHLSITQNVIQRMAANSASCKAYCITLVSAILVLVADKGKPVYFLIALIPTALFFILDSYYLALERMFRASYNVFIGKLHTGAIKASDLFAVQPTGKLFPLIGASAVSFSIWPFYLTLVAMVLIAQQLLK
jgi:hypothetical protein